MTTFDEREAAFERKFVLDEEQAFRAVARRNRLLGEWVAQKIGKTGEDATAYAWSVVQADVAEAGHEDVFRKVRADLDAAGANVSDAELRHKMGELLGQASVEVAEGL